MPDKIVPPPHTLIPAGEFQVGDALFFCARVHFVRGVTKEEYSVRLWLASSIDAEADWKPIFRYTDNLMRLTEGVTP